MLFRLAFCQVFWTRRYNGQRHETNGGSGQNEARRRNMRESEHAMECLRASLTKVCKHTLSGGFLLTG